MRDGRVQQALSDELSTLLEVAHEATNGIEFEPLHNLLSQCERVCEGQNDKRTVRLVHHFACTGGTLITRALASLPNAIVLSEIDPLSTMKISSQLSSSGHVPFSPTDIIFALKHSIRPVGDDAIIASFLASLSAAKEKLEGRGHYLILRDHSHSQFCLGGVDFDQRPSLRDIVADQFTPLSLLTVRHPLDSYLSLQANRWVSFSPDTLEEYARRYLAFLERHKGVPIFFYENYIENPTGELQKMSDCLKLPYSDVAIDVSGYVPMSGASGRSNRQIGHRPRRNIPDDVSTQRREGSSYLSLCERLGYSP